MALLDSIPTADSGGIPQADWRKVQAGDVVRSQSGAVRPGVLPAHYGALVTGTSGMAYSVAPFNAITSRAGGQNAEKVANDSATSVATTAAPGSNSRVDVIWVRAQFVTNADANNLVVFGVTQGAAGTTPTKPAIPAGALELATAVVTSTTTQTSTATIAQTAQYTALAGGTVAFRNDSDMQAFTPAAGTRGYRIDTGTTWSYDGFNWTLADAGMLLIRPTSVSGGGLAANGTIQVAGGTSVLVNGAFSARYRHYRLIMRAGLTGAGNVRAVLTSGGGDRANANYRTIASVVPGNSGAAVTSYAEGPTVTNWFLTSVGTTKKMIALDLFNPAVGEETYGMGQVADWGGTTVASETWTGAFENAVANDGIRIFIQDGAAFTTADLKIYAYA